MQSYYKCLVFDNWHLYFVKREPLLLSAVLQLKHLAVLGRGWVDLRIQQQLLEGLTISVGLAQNRRV